MALAPGHLLGQFIGNVLEAAIQPYLQDLADRHDLFLDVHGDRPGVREGKKLTWTDDLGNSHDLDFVLERGGSRTRQGQPAAFVESAWRRYTKHSKAKSQEIQGAILPVLAKWAQVQPVPAAIVAGEWTAAALRQLETSGFVVLHLHFPTTVRAFRSMGLNIAGVGEATDDNFWQAQVDRYRDLSPEELAGLAATLRKDHADGFLRFSKNLERRMIRTVDYVVVTPLHGAARQFSAVIDAVDLVADYSLGEESGPFLRFEIRLVYTNGDKIDASFASPTDAIAFLSTFT